MIGLLITAAVLLIAGTLLLWFRARALAQLLELRATQTQPIAEIVEMQRSVAGEVGPGGFSQLVETNGTIVCDEPLRAELSGEPCAYYEMQVEERYEERYVERDGQGREVERSRTGSETVAQNRQTGCFFVEADGARIRVLPEGAKLDLVKRVDRFEPYQPGMGSLSLGSFVMELAHGATGGRRILGYHYSESILPLGRPLYVIGQAVDRGGELRITKPEEKGKPFIVSLKSEEEVTRGMQSSSKWLGIGTLLCFFVAAALIVVGILS